MGKIGTSEFSSVRKKHVFFLSCSYNIIFRFYIFLLFLEKKNYSDVQELSVCVSSKLTASEVKLITSRDRMCYINFDAKNMFLEQQKWKLFNLVSVSEKASYERKLESSSSPICGATRQTATSRLRSTFNMLPKTPRGGGGGGAGTNETTNNPPPLNNQRLKASKVVATVYCARKAGYYFFNAFFLIFLITVLAFNIFSVDCKLPQNRLQITTTLLLTSVSFKWVINRSLPAVSYLTSLDKYAIISILFICLLCVWHAIIGSAWQSDLKWSQELDKWALFTFAIAFLIYNTTFVIWLFVASKSQRDLKKREKNFMRALESLIHQQEDSFINLQTVNDNEEIYDNSSTV